MSLVKSFSQKSRILASFVSIGGALTLNIAYPDHASEANGLIVMGRASERRYEMQSKVTRHMAYRNYMKMASGSRLRLLKPTV